MCGQLNFPLVGQLEQAAELPLVLYKMAPMFNLWHDGECVLCMVIFWFLGLLQWVSKDEQLKTVDESLYKKFVGNLIYLITTRSNIHFVDGMLSKYLNAPKICYNTTKRVLRNINNTLNYGILFEKRKFSGWVDMQMHIGQVQRLIRNQLQSTRYTFSRESGAILWISKK